MSKPTISYNVGDTDVSVSIDNFFDGDENQPILFITVNGTLHPALTFEQYSIIAKLIETLDD
jgi:hypothetical protein|tara:strand:+ start:6254 stop:6439 length:186 start_codon:yes stop_codon:yes gene_type:complete